jgi:hypothetical protein
MHTGKEGSKADEHIRVSESTKRKLDKVATYLAGQREKKDVPYDEVVSFLAEKFEESQK